MATEADKYTDLVERYRGYAFGNYTRFDIAGRAAMAEWRLEELRWQNAELRETIRQLTSAAVDSAVARAESGA